jgi:hypothetical protein
VDHTGYRARRIGEIVLYNETDCVMAILEAVPLSRRFVDYKLHHNFRCPTVASCRKTKYKETTSSSP